MTAQTTVKDPLISLSTGRTLISKLGDIVSAADYGATTAGTAAANTTAINTAIAACATGFILIPPGVAYTESSLVMEDDVTLIIFGSNATVTFLSKSQGDSPTNKGGIVIKSQNDTGVLLKATDYGVTAEPVIQVCDATTGDLAVLESKFFELTEVSTPTAPSANKARLYLKDNGGGVTQLMMLSATGAAVQVAIQGQKVALDGSVTWDPGSIAKGDIATTTLTVTGAVVGDFCLVSASIETQELVLDAHVGATDTVHLVLHNGTAGAVDLASATYYVRVFPR
jgi:hypothetical protein